MSICCACADSSWYFHGLKVLLLLVWWKIFCRAATSRPMVGNISEVGRGRVMSFGYWCRIYMRRRILKWWSITFIHIVVKMFCPKIYLVYTDIKHSKTTSSFFRETRTVDKQVFSAHLFIMLWTETISHIVHFLPPDCDSALCWQPERSWCDAAICWRNKVHHLTPPLNEKPNIHTASATTWNHDE